MKLPLDQRTTFINSVLTLTWDCHYWSRDEQLFACAEGWAFNMFDDLIERYDAQGGSYTDFATDQEALAYVTKRAEEGSPLHCRALVLHMAAVLKGARAK